jgi:hypothetical protein
MSNYNEWLKTQSNEVQNDILGTHKASKFRDGSISFDKFDGTKPLSLEDFKSKAKLISGKATPETK